MLHSRYVGTELLGLTNLERAEAETDAAGCVEPLLIRVCDGNRCCLDWDEARVKITRGILVFVARMKRAQMRLVCASSWVSLVGYFK